MEPRSSRSGHLEAIDFLLTLTAGFRYDYHNIYGNQYSGRFGIVSWPMEQLYLKLLYGSAFKAPSPTLLYGIPATVGDIIGNQGIGSSVCSYRRRSSYLYPV